MQRIPRPQFLLLGLSHGKYPKAYRFWGIYSSRILLPSPSPVNHSTHFLLGKVFVDKNLEYIWKQIQRNSIQSYQIRNTVLKPLPTERFATKESMSGKAEILYIEFLDIMSGYSYRETEVDKKCVCFLLVLLSRILLTLSFHVFFFRFPWTHTFAYHWRRMSIHHFCQRWGQLWMVICFYGDTNVLAYLIITHFCEAFPSQ